MMHLHIRTVDMANWWNCGTDFGPGYLPLAIASLFFIISWLLVELLCSFALEEEPLSFYESRYGEVVLAWFRSVCVLLVMMGKRHFYKVGGCLWVTSLLPLPLNGLRRCFWYHTYCCQFYSHLCVTETGHATVVLFSGTTLNFYVSQVRDILNIWQRDATLYNTYQTQMKGNKFDRFQHTLWAPAGL